MTTAPHRDATPAGQAALAHGDVIVLDYLAALWAESDDLSPELRDELMSTVADYIAMRRTSTSDPLADPEQIVGRLGPPEVLVAAVRRGRMPMHLRLPVPPRTASMAPAVVPATVAGPSAADSTAIVLLMAGSFVMPVVSPLAGLVLVSSSQRWSREHKAAAWVLAVGGTAAALFVMVLLAAATSNAGPALVMAYLIMVTGSVVAGLCLLPGLGRRHGRPSA
jgi:hypothetical protein